MYIKLEESILSRDSLSTDASIRLSLHLQKYLARKYILPIFHKMFMGKVNVLHLEFISANLQIT